MKPMEGIALLLLLLLSLCVTARATVGAAQHAGECPPIEDIKLGICGETCDQDEECVDEMKCCPNTCGEKSCRKIDPPTPAPPIALGNETTTTPIYNQTALYNRTGNE